MSQASNWYDSEISNIDLGDIRLNKRSGNLLNSLFNNPNSSINSSCKGWQEVKAAYRFLNHSNINMSKILSPHKLSTAERVSKEEIILCIQDTTEFNYSHRRKNISGLGLLRNSKEQGFFYHPTLCFTPDRLCLGLVHHHTFTRDSFHSKAERSGNKAKPIESKESYRWIESYNACSNLSNKYLKTHIINIADREGDFYEFLQQKQLSNSKVDYIIRAKSNRVTPDNDKLFNKVKSSPVIGKISFTMSGLKNGSSSSSKKQRKSRKIVQEIRSVKVSLDPPRKVKKMNKLESIKVTAILCSEVNPPVGEERIEWLLLTSIELDNKKFKAKQIIDYYLCRWQIEIFFKVLKSGCTIEKLQFESLNSLSNALALYTIVSWRLLYLTMVGRKCPDLPCDLIYDESEWKILYSIFYKEAPPNQPPTLYQMSRMIASFGGFLGRKGDGEPGIKTMWIGLQRMKDFVIGMESAHLVKNIYG